MATASDVLAKPMQGKYDGRKSNGVAGFGKKIRKRLLHKTIENAIISLESIVADTAHKQCFDACKFVIEQGIGRAPFADTETARARPIDNRLQVAIQNLIMPSEPKLLKPKSQATLDLHRRRVPQATVDTQVIDDVTGDVTSDPSGREGPPGQ